MVQSEIGKNAAQEFLLNLITWDIFIDVFYSVYMS